MNLSLIISIIVFVILITCAWQGFKKGIIMGIIEILVLLISVFGGQLLADAYAYEVIPALKPFVAGYMEQKVQNNTYEIMGYTPDEEGNYDVPYSMSDLLADHPEAEDSIYIMTYEKLGISQTASEKLAVKAKEYKSSTNSTVVNAAIYILCQAITWVLAFGLGFILIFIVLTVIVNLPNLSFRIPFIGIINDLGGLALGIVSGFLFCSLLLWFLQYMGILFPEDVLRSSNIAAHFMDKNLLNDLINF